MLTDLQSGASESDAPELRAALPDHPRLAADDTCASAELRSLITGCGVYILADRGKILINGEDRTRWLNGMVTNIVRDLAADHGVYAFLLNPQGRIQGDLYAFNRVAFNRGADILLDVDRGQAANLLAVFDHYIVMDDVLIEDATNQLAAIGLQGPKARMVLEASGIAVPELEQLQIASLTWRGSGGTLVRAEAWKGEAYEIWLEPEQGAAALEALRQAWATSVVST